ncbi:MAG: hypothetical protein M0C28_20375 [Candidatus Moduliflexus flocculans]|nr:hypothetical protein [Candidatus Moduliflexus flocculans]
MALAESASRGRPPQGRPVRGGRFLRPHRPPGLVPAGHRRAGPGLRSVDRPRLGLLLRPQEAGRLRCDGRPGPHRSPARDGPRISGTRCR